MNINITKKNADEIIQYAFRDIDENKRKYLTWFKLNIFEYKRRTCFGDYNQRDYTIRLFEVKNNAPTMNNFVAMLHECAHHIEFSLYRRTAHSKRFYEILQLLINAAIELNKIEPRDVFSMPRETSCHNKMVNMAKNYKKQEPIYYETKLIEISNAFSIKEDLKKSGYRWNSINKTWYKNISSQFLIIEKENLKNLKIDLKNINILKGE